MAKRALKGIDGWLLVFMAALIVTAIVHLVIFGIGLDKQAWLSAHYGPLPLSIMISGWIYHLMRIVLPLAIFWRMLRVRRWSSVQLALAGLWLLFVGVELLDCLYALWLQPHGWDLLSGTLASTLLKGAFFALVGTVYLLGSVRVANTYPRADAPEVVAELFE